MAAIEPELVARLYREQAGSLVLFARQWCTTPEDVVQEAFIALARQRSLPERPEAWLYRAVRNAAIGASRSASRRRRHEARGAVGEAWFAETDDRLDALQATATLGALPLPVREVIVARIWGGLTLEEIATLAGCSVTTAHRRYHEGLTVLKERLEGPCEAKSIPTTASSRPSSSD